MRGPALSAMSLFTLSGCVTMMGSSAPLTSSPPAFCAEAKPIYWADGDTDPTIAQVKAHNAVGRRLCAWGG